LKKHLHALRFPINHELKSATEQSLRQQPEMFPLARAENLRDSGIKYVMIKVFKMLKQVEEVI